MTDRKGSEPLILASVSPRRKELLKRISSPFQIIDSGVEERISLGSPPAAVASVLANQKVMTVAENIVEGIVLAADTVIGFRGMVLGKPRSSSDAMAMLQLLRGHTHEVITGLAVMNKRQGFRIVSTVSTVVQMREYDDREVREYVRTGEPFDKAGAYAIQGRGSRLIESIQGCYNNVIGLPLCEVVELLKSVGLPLAEEGRICRLPSDEFCPRLREAGMYD